MLVEWRRELNLDVKKKRSQTSEDKIQSYTKTEEYSHPVKPVTKWGSLPGPSAVWQLRDPLKNGMQSLWLCWYRTELMTRWPKDPVATNTLERNLDT